nr:MAG TPA: hypothetical protein [Bacteriophage sp.]
MLIYSSIFSFFISTIIPLLLSDSKHKTHFSNKIFVMY